MNTIWDHTKNYQRVLLKDLEVEAHVGLHPWEKHPERPTRLIVNIECFASLTNKQPHSSENILNYDLLRDHLKSWPTRPHTLLLETLVEELIAFAFRNQKVEACRVSIMKPDIFNECAGAGVEIYRLRP